MPWAVSGFGELGLSRFVLRDSSGLRRDHLPVSAVSFIAVCVCVCVTHTHLWRAELWGIQG